jgi:hypothetical protein
MGETATRHTKANPSSEADLVNSKPAFERSPARRHAPKVPIELSVESGRFLIQLFIKSNNLIENNGANGAFFCNHLLFGIKSMIFTYRY